jgi:hypothetical protein
LMSRLHFFEKVPHLLTHRVDRARFGRERETRPARGVTRVG